MLTAMTMTESRPAKRIHRHRLVIELLILALLIVVQVIFCRQSWLPYYVDQHEGIFMRWQDDGTPTFWTDIPTLPK